MEEELRRIHLAKRDTGFAIVHVEGPGSWTYTVGLADHLRPELVVAGVRPSSAYPLLRALGDRVVKGEQLGAGVIEEQGELFGLVPVHPTRLEAGLCALWIAYDQAYPLAGRLRVLQVQPPADWLCACCRDRQPRLDLPGAGPGTPNREMRRQAKRRDRVRR